MNIENLSVGLRIFNYRKLCELLGESVEAGNTKKPSFENGISILHSNVKKRLHHHGELSVAKADK